MVMARRFGWSALLVALICAGLSSLAPDAGARPDGIDMTATIEDRDIAGTDARNPLRLDPNGTVRVVVELTNNTATPLQVRQVELTGRVLGLSFFSYATAVESTVEPGRHETLRYRLDLSGLDGQATGLIGAELAVRGADREVAAAIPVVTDVRGSLRSVYGLFGIALAVLTALAIADTALSIARHRLSANRWQRGLRLLAPGVGIGLVFAFTASVLRWWVPETRLWLAFTGVAAVVAFLIGYASPTPTTEADELAEDLEAAEDELDELDPERRARNHTEPDPNLLAAGVGAPGWPGAGPNQPAAPEAQGWPGSDFGQPGVVPGSPGWTDSAPNQPGLPDWTGSDPGQPNSMPGSPGWTEADPNRSGVPGWAGSGSGQPSLVPGSPGWAGADPNQSGVPGWAGSGSGQPSLAPGAPGWAEADPNQPDAAAGVPGWTGSGSDQPKVFPEASGWSGSEPTAPGLSDPTVPGGPGTGASGSGGAEPDSGGSGRMETEPRGAGSGSVVPERAEPTVVRDPVAAERAAQAWAGRDPARWDTGDESETVRFPGERPKQ